MRVNLNIHHSVIQMYKDHPNENKHGQFMQICKKTVTITCIWQTWGGGRRCWGKEGVPLFLRGEKEAFRNALIGSCWQGKLEVGLLEGKSPLTLVWGPYLVFSGWFWVGSGDEWQKLEKQVIIEYILTMWGPIAIEVVVWVPGLVATEAMYQSSTVMNVLAIFVCWYVQSLSITAYMFTKPCRVPSTV